jgi:very-short-patch-repair endonuclease
MTLPEVLLWQRLRKKPLGVKFRKQHPIGDDVVDFYCDQARTIIEVDGIVHDMGDQPEWDEQRNEELRGEGYRVVRILAVDVLRDPAAMAEAIVTMCQTDPPPSALRAATSPGGGGSKRSST